MGNPKTEPKTEPHSATDYAIDFIEQENAAILYMLEELDTAIDPNHPKFSQYQSVRGFFCKHGELDPKSKKTLIRLYESFTDIHYDN